MLEKKKKSINLALKEIKILLDKIEKLRKNNPPTEGYLCAESRLLRNVKSRLDDIDSINNPENPWVPIFYP